MNRYDLNVNNVVLAREVVGLLQNLRGGYDATTFQTIVASETGAACNSRYVPGTDACPAFILARSGVYQFVFINGSESAAQMNGYWSGCLGSRLVTSTDPVNDYLVAASKIIRDAGAESAFALPSVPFVIGYSLGGAIGVQLVGDLLDAGTPVTPKLITFGSPRSGGVSLQAKIGNGFTARWMNDDDAVPLIPPTLAQWPGLIAVYGLSQCIRLSNYVHTAGGINLTLGGTATPAELPAIAALASGSNIAAWLFAQETAASGGHTINQYVRRLFTAVEQYNRPQVQDIAVAPREPRNPLPAREGNQQEQAAVRTIFNTGAQQNANPVIIPTAKEFVAQRIGRIWVVFFNNEVVATGPTKRRARAMANAGNRLLREMQIQAVVDPAAMIGQLTSYLGDAVDPTGGFVPVLNTTWPTA